MKSILTATTVALLWCGQAWAQDAPEVYGKKCKACHSIGGVGGPMAKSGGALDDVGTRRDEAWLRAYLADPKSQIPTAKMPKMRLTDDEWNAIIKYLLTLKTPAS